MNSVSGLLIVNSIGLAIIVSFISAVVKALHVYNKERKKIPPEFDVLDAVILTISGTFVGMLGYFSVISFHEDETIALISGAVVALIGMAVILELAELFVRKYLGIKVNSNKPQLDPVERPPYAVDQPLPPISDTTSKGDNK